MSIRAEIQSLSPSAMVELFILDLSNFGQQPVYFHAGTNEVQQPIIWQGQEYASLPIEAEGFDLTTKGALPRPKIRIANINGLLSAEVREYDDLTGCKVVRKRTFAKYLDPINFPGGVNPDADPNQHLTDDNWFVERKVTENRYMIEWELSSAFDLQGVKLPYRQVIQNSCPWRYRGAECGYTGPWVDKEDRLTGTQSMDACSKRLASCIIRFKDTSGGVAPLPFGGFPGARRSD